MKSVEMSNAMKEGMRRLASGVCVITAKDSTGGAYAMTATSVTSVSDQPASLLVCINKDTRMYQAIEEGGDFCVNLLTHDQEEISNRCASGDQGEDRFQSGQWQEMRSLPYLESGLAAFFCRQAQSVDFGTHRIVIGEIQEVLVAKDDIINPLIYLNGGYGTLGGQ
ncbi:MAG: flavin reductase family protein [Cellvibrionaceae bacterium]